MLHADVTEYLCTTAYLDPLFRSKILHDVLVDRSRIVTPPPHVDLGRVVRHCVAAHRRHLAFQLRLLALPALVVLVVDLVELLKGQAVPLWLLAVQLGLAYGGLWGASKLRRRPSGKSVPRLLAAVARGLPAAMLGILIARITPLTVSGPLLGPLAGAILAMLFHCLQTEPGTIKGLVLHGPPKISKLSPVVRPRLGDIEAQQAGNVRLHAEWRKYPFVDCGAPRSLRRGVFQVPLDPADQALPIKDFDIDELVDHVRVTAEQIELHGVRGFVRAEDRIYVGDETASRRPCWRDPTTGRPAVTVQGLDLVELIRHPQPFARHHLAIVVSDQGEQGWCDQLVFTMTVRFHRDGSMLTLESNQFLYFPLKPQYLAVDRPPSGSEWLPRLLLEALVDAPLAVVGAAKELGAGLGLTVRVLCSGLKHRCFERAGRRYVDRKVFDLRGYASADTLTHNQAVDVTRYQRLVEAEVARATREFLHDHNVSTAALAGEQMTQVFTNIVNNGVMGLVKATNAAVGEGASVTASADPSSEAA